MGRLPAIGSNCPESVTCEVFEFIASCLMIATGLRVYCLQRISFALLTDGACLRF